jgi:hypothetical protein
MENQEIFGSFKWKVDLFFGSKGDPHSHDRVNYFHSHVNTKTKRCHVQIERLSSNVDLYKYMNNINGGVEILEAPCGDEYGIYNNVCLHHMFNVLHCKKPLTIFVLQGLLPT